MNEWIHGKMEARSQECMNHWIDEKISGIDVWFATGHMEGWTRSSKKNQAK